MRVEPLGEHALRVDLPARARGRSVLEALRALAGVSDAVVTERHACVYFDGEPPDRDALRAAIDRASAQPSQGALHVVRVRYDGADLAEVAARAGLTAREVVALHARATYEVRAIGFQPGFAYLGELDPRLVLPRRGTPRARVPVGAVAIAARYTGIYPFASPGGWHLIASAIDFAPFDPERGAALALGDRVRFEEAP